MYLNSFANFPAVFLLSVLVAGCHGGDKADGAGETGVAPVIDADGDGYTTEEDCDDDASTVFPGAPLICGDRRVNDCDSDATTEAAACALTGPVDMDGDIEALGMTELAMTSGASVEAFGAVLLDLDAGPVGTADDEYLRDSVAASAPVGSGVASDLYWTGSRYVGSEGYDPDVTLSGAGWRGWPGDETGAALASLGAICEPGTATLVVGSPGADTISLLDLPDALEGGDGSLARATIWDHLTGPTSFGSALGSEVLEGSSTLVVGAPSNNTASYARFSEGLGCDGLSRSVQELVTPAGAEGFGATVAAVAMTNPWYSDVFVSGDDDGAAALWFFDSNCVESGDDCGVRIDLGELRGPITALAALDIAGGSDDPCSPDGELDLIVGAAESGDEGQGQVMVLEGDGSGGLVYNPAGIGVRTGLASGDRFGASLAVGSTPLPGAREGTTPLLAVGAPGAEAEGKDERPHDGVVYAWIGPDAWCGTGGALAPSFTLEGGAGAELGTALAIGRNLEGDPAHFPELVAGAPGMGAGSGGLFMVPFFPY